MDNSLLDRLKSLGVQIGASQVKPQVISNDRIPIDHVVDGFERNTLFGTAFLVDEIFGREYQHGIVPFDEPVDYGILGEWAGYPELKQNSLQSFIFLDTETSGLSGGTGTFAFMIGLGWWEQNNFRLQQFFLREPAEETAMLAALDELLTPFQTVVTFNGKSFDVPLLNGRHILSALRTPFQEMQHLDILALSRRIWRNRLPSRALGSLEQDVLAVTRSQEEIPGWMIPEMYFNYLKTGDSRPMAGVFYHNKMDILSLAALFLHVSKLLTEPMQWLADEGLDLIAIARLYDQTGRRAQAVDLYEHALTLGLPKPFFIQTLYRYAELARRDGNWVQAVELWQKTSEFHEIPACIELAKYYEHHLRNYGSAKEWTRKAQEYLESSVQPLYIKKDQMVELEKRLVRVQAKISRMKAADNSANQVEADDGQL